MGKRFFLIPMFLLVVTQVAIISRIQYGGVKLSQMVPEIDYLVELVLQMDLHHEDVSVEIFLPTNTENQTVGSERIESSRLAQTSSACFFSG